MAARVRVRRPGRETFRPPSVSNWQASASHGNARKRGRGRPTEGDHVFADHVSVRPPATGLTPAAGGQRIRLGAEGPNTPF